MPLFKRMLNVFAIFSTLIVLSYCQNSGWWTTIMKFKGTSSVKDKKDFCGNEAIANIHDALPDICQYLNIQDLCNAKAVCKILSEVADGEIIKRSVEVRNVEIKSRNREEFRAAMPYPERMKPKLALIMTDDDLESHDSSSRELYSQYLPLMTRDAVLLHSIGVAVKINSTKVETMNNRAAAIFFQANDKHVKIRYGVSSLMSFANIISAENQLIMDSFPETWGSENVPSTSGGFAYLLFNTGIDTFDVLSHRTQRILNKLTRMYDKYPGQFALWGGETKFMDTSMVKGQTFLSHFGASISGPGVKSWSLVIDADADGIEIKKKIQDFKNSISLPKTVVVLSSSTDSEKTDIYRVKALRVSNAFSKIFPDLTITTFSNEAGKSKFCADSWINSQESGEPRVPTRLLYGDNYVCYLIISYFMNTY